MLQYIIRRLLWAVVMLVLVTAVVFTIFFVLPGGAGKSQSGECTSPVAVKMAGRNPRPELVCNITKRLGLDQPVYVQFWRYVKGLPTGDLGYSYHSQDDVRDLLLRRAPATISLAIGASIIWLTIGVSVGVISALRRRTIFDRGAMFLALIGVSMPIFFIGLVAVFFFDGKLNIYSVASYVPFTEDPVAWLAAMWLPWIILAIVSAAVYARMVRGNLLDVMTEDYIRTARRERSQGEVGHEACLEERAHSRRDALWAGPRHLVGGCRHHGADLQYPRHR